MHYIPMKIFFPTSPSPSPSPIPPPLSLRDSTSSILIFRKSINSEEFQANSYCYAFNLVGREIRDRFSGAVEAFARRNGSRHGLHGEHSRHRSSDDVPSSRDVVRTFYFILFYSILFFFLVKLSFT